MLAVFFAKRVEPVQKQANEGVYRASREAPQEIGHQVERATVAALDKALVEFVGTAIGDNECRHDKDPQPLPLGPLGARPPHGKAARKRRIFAEMRQLVPDLRKVFQLLVSKRRQFEDDCHA